MSDSAHGLRAPVVRAAVALGVAAYGAASVLLATSEQRATSYLAAERTQTAGLVAGVVLLGVGAGLVVLGDPERWGLLALGLGLAWLAPAWSGWEAGPSAVRSTAVVAAPLLVPLLVHNWHRARGPGAARALLAAAWVGVGVLVLLRALLHDPHRDRYCWVDCGADANAFLLHPDTATARALGAALLVLVVALAVAVPVLTAARPSRVVDPVRGPVVVAAALALVGEAAYAVTLLLDPLERFDSEPGTTLFLLRSVALALVGGAVGVAGGSALLRRGRVAALAAQLGSGPGDLRTHLARTLRDPTLRVDYWSTVEGRYVDGHGFPVPDAEGDGRAAVRVVHGGRPVAVIRHDARRADVRNWAGQLGSGARLTLDNARLEAERLAQVRALRDSRARIVEAADQHRRGLERDLHDGGQQRLIAATFELRLAAGDADARDDQALVAQLRAAVERATDVRERLRDFAHGVFPAVLDEAGLGEALQSLVDTAPRPILLVYDAPVRPPEAAARAAYLVARAAVESAGGEREVVLEVSARSGRLEVRADGVGAVDLTHLEDRVGAVGGTVRRVGSRLEAVLP